MYPHLPVNKAIKTTITFVNEDGSLPIMPLASAHYIVMDENEATLFSGSLDADALAVGSFVVTTPAAHNALAVGAVRGLRSIVMTTVDADDAVSVTIERFYIELNQTVKIGLNSLMSFSQALMLVPEIPQLVGWDSALSDKDRKSALVEAFERLGRYRLNSKFDHSTVSSHSEMDLLLLDTKTLNDFRKAQLIEANALLGGEPHHDRRLQGLMSESVGESTAFYRTGMALSRGISSKAYAYVVRYLDNVTLCGRG